MTSLGRARPSAARSVPIGALPRPHLPGRPLRTTVTAPTSARAVELTHSFNLHHRETSGSAPIGDAAIV